MWGDAGDEPTIWDVRVDEQGRTYVETDDPEHPQYVSMDRWPSHKHRDRVKQKRERQKSRR